MSGFQKEYEINYYQIDQNKEATPVSILHFLEDVATFHSESVGLGIDRLLEEGTAWILQRWLLKMERYPVLGEKITTETWPSRFEHFSATREFRMEDAEGRLIGWASSLWIYLNTAKKRPVRIPEQFGRAYGLDQNRSLQAPFERFQKMTEANSEINFHVRRSDIDTNGHVNNVRYVDWMLEGIPEDLIRDHQLAELEVLYKKETLYGEDIVSECLLIGQNQPEYLHRITDENKKHDLALGRTVWRKR